jgi:hypothetical protein
MEMSQITNRIDHVAWMCRPENHDAYVEKLSKLFNITFEADDGGPDFGLRFTWSWSAGLEVLSPAGDGDHAKMCWKYLDEKGEGLFAVVMGVADVEETRQHAVDLGYMPSHLLKLHGDLEEAHAKGGVPFDREKEWMRRVQDCTECVLEHWLGGNLAIGRIVTDEPGRSEGGSQAEPTRVVAAK